MGRVQLVSSSSDQLRQLYLVSLFHTKLKSHRLTAQLDILLDDTRLDIIIPIFWQTSHITLHIPSDTLAPIPNFRLR